jgi:hypothetical protein
MRLTGNGNVEIYVKTSIGRLVKVLHICICEEDANQLCLKDDRLAVVACPGGLVLLGDKNDNGIPILKN